MTEILTVPGSAHPSAGKSGGGGGVSGFLGHLAGDVRDATVGLPMGLVQTVEHPIASVENMGKATWHDWSPLFHGNFSKFGHQVYDHPLAPLLDVATVFSGGAALGGKIAGELSKAGVDNSLVNALKAGAHTHVLTDPVAPAEGMAPRAAQAFETSANPLKRGLQNKMIQLSGQYAEHLPKWFTPAGKYERLHVTRSMDRHAGMIRANKDALDAYNLQIAAIQKGGEALVHNEAQLTPMILNHIYNGTETNAMKFNDYLRTPTGRKITTDGGMKPVYQALPKGWRYLHMNDAHLQDLFKHDPNRTIEERLQQLGNLMTTSDPLKASRDAKGNALLVQSRSLHDLGVEGANSSIFMKKWYRYPTTVWKTALVGLSPKMVVDNAIGNWIMYAMKQGGHHALRGIADAIHQTRGLKVAKTSLNEATNQVLKPHWMEKYFKQELGQSFFGSTLKDNLTAGADATASKGVTGKLREGFYPLVHRIADQPVRRSAINAFMHSAPEVKTAMKRADINTFDQAVAHALKNDKTGLARRAVDHSRAIGGDYHTISNSGRMVKDLVPFYMWDRHILRHFGNVLTESPGRVAALQAVSHQGVDKTKAMLGSIPEFMYGNIPMGNLANGRKRVLSTQGLNPYSTMADLADAFTAATTGGQKATAGEAIGGDLNPVITNLFEGLSGHRIGTDATVKQHGGVATTALVNMLQGLPQYQVAARAANPGGNNDQPTKTASGHTKQPTLYANSMRELITNLLGAPMKDFSPQNAAKLQAAQDHIKKGRGKLEMLTP